MSLLLGLTHLLDLGLHGLLVLLRELLGEFFPSGDLPLGLLLIAFQHCSAQLEEVGIYEWEATGVTSSWQNRQNLASTLMDSAQ